MDITCVPTSSYHSRVRTRVCHACGHPEVKQPAVAAEMQSTNHFAFWKDDSVFSVDVIKSGRAVVVSALSGQVISEVGTVVMDKFPCMLIDCPRMGGGKGRGKPSLLGFNFECNVASDFVVLMRMAGFTLG